MVLLALLGFILRPVNVIVDGQVIPVTGRLNVQDTLENAGLEVHPNDRVEPAPEALVPLDGKIYVTRANQVTLWDNGKTRPITAPGNTPGSLLKAAGVKLHAQDRLYWNGAPITAGAPLPDEQAAVLQIERARVVIIDHDGQRRQLETAAQTVSEAFWEAGILIGPSDLLSAPPEASLAALSKNGPPVIALRSAQPLTILSAGEQIHVRTTAETVGQALAGAGVTLQGLDYSIPAENRPLPDDGKVRVVRVREEVALLQEALPYDSTRVPDPEFEADQTRLLQAGEYGVKVARERARFENGEEISRAVDSDWVAKEPVAETVGVGTKIVVKTLDVDGGQIEYWRAVSVYATSYSPCRLGTGDGRCGNTTASGLPLRKGMIAVTRAWYNIIRGLEVYVPRYGRGIIADVGGGIPGRPWIDLGFEDHDFEGIVGWTTMYFLTPIPANTDWSLP